MVGVGVGVVGGKDNAIVFDVVVVLDEEVALDEEVGVF